MREQNKLSDPNMTMDNATHTYNLATHPELDFVSVTTFVSGFFRPFDKERIAKKLVTTHPKYLGRSPETLIAEWDAAGEYGTIVHKEMEDWIREGIEPKERKAIVGKNWLNNYKMDIDMDISTEVMVYSKELRIAGTIDVLVRDRENGEYQIIDWKTSKRIDKNSFKGKVGNSPETISVMDCNFNHYALQLSLYRYLLEEYYGIIVDKQLIAHLQDHGAKGHHTPYMREHIIEMLKGDRK